MEPLGFNSGTIQVKGKLAAVEREREGKKEKIDNLGLKSNYVQEERDLGLL